MTIEFVSPVGRLVQGGPTLETKMDSRTRQPKLDKDGNQIKECFLALAIRKDDPGLPAFYANFVNAARADFPHLMNPDGSSKHPKFAWKVQDGDGVDTNGESVADKPGFAGCWVFKMSTRYAPKCFHEGKFDASQQMQNPENFIKRGYFIRVGGTIRGNDVSPQERDAVPGLYVSPNLISLVAFGDEIVGGPDASKVFGETAVGPLPPGASAAPVMGAPAMPAMPGAAPATPAMPAMPGAAPATPAMPAMPGAAPATPAMPAMPGAAAGPTYTMTALALGNTREALIAAGWTDEALLSQGMMVAS